MKKTKENLLKAAAEMFAKAGFDGVSTRELAKKAKCNLCAINYYFGNKEKLYEAVIENLCDYIRGNVICEIVKAFAGTDSAGTENSTGTQISTARGKISFMLGKFFDAICSGKIKQSNVELLLRELLNPSSAYEIFYKVFSPIHQQLSALICEDCGWPSDDRRAILLAHTLIGQVIPFKIHKEALLRRLGVKTYTAELSAEIHKLLAQNVDGILDKAKGELK